jgi:hypothetical protein
MEDIGIFYGNLVYFMLVLYILCMAFWYIYGNLVHFPILVSCSKKNLATLPQTALIGPLYLNSSFENSTVDICAEMSSATDVF